MSYATIALCARDSAFLDRVQSALVQEGHSVISASGDYPWQISSASDIEESYAYALTAENPNPGGDETVITDGMILAYVQSNPPTQP